LIDYNINKAAELLKAAGWKDSDNDGVLDKIINGKKLKLEIELAYLTTQPEWKEMATLVSESMAKCGVKANTIPFEFPIWNEKSTNRDFDMLMGSWNSSSMPDDYEQLWSTNSWLNGGQNFTGFGNEISDQLIDSINHTLNYDKRIILEKKLQKIIYDEQPYIFMYGLVRRCVIHKRFDNAEFYAERPGILYNILFTSIIFLCAFVPLPVGTVFLSCLSLCIYCRFIYEIDWFRREVLTCLCSSL
jgi:ABC-type transport system substrate-binding protein